MRRCFACSRVSPPSPAPRQPTAAEQRAARTIQRIWRGASTRTALRTGTMRRNVHAKRVASLAALKSLPENVKRKIVSQSSPHIPIPRSFNKKEAPKRQLSPNMKRFLQVAHADPYALNENVYENFLNRVGHYTFWSSNRANKIKAILARYELLQPDPRYPNAAVERSPSVIAWRRRLETNFKRKYVPRRPNRLSSRELYAFLQTVPIQYLRHTARRAPRYA